MLKHKELINSERVLCRVWVRTKIIMKIIPNSNKIKVDSILFVSLYHCIIIGCATKNTMDILKNE